MMISLKSKGLVLPAQCSKCFSVFTTQCQKSHYDTLGVASNASQAEVKSAYYKLSKKYHPDANINDPTATAKFQEISEAYEIVGNDDSRMRYDKGMSPRMTSIRHSTSKAPEDPKAAFYKSRLMNKMSNSPTTGRSYNFDEWTKSHYSASVVSNRKMREQTLSRSNIKYSQSGKVSSTPIDKKGERILATVLGTVILVSVVLYQLDRPDNPQYSR